MITTDQAGNSTTVEVNFEVIIDAVVDVKPDTLNLKSKSDRNAVTVYIELPSGCDVAEIDVASVNMDINGPLIAAQSFPTVVGDYDADGIADRMIKFDRQLVVTALNGTTGNITLAMSGQLIDGRRFAGTAAIKVINPGK